MLRTDTSKYTAVERYYNIHRLLGQGAFGRVYLGESKVTGASRALKFIKHSSMTNRDSFLKEVNIQTRLKHRNVLELVGYIDGPDYVCVILEYAHRGSLRDHLQKSAIFSEQTSGNIIGQVAAGLEYCHRSCVIHRDLKPDNLLVTGSGNIKIADFGLSAFATRPRFTMCGTSEYMAPEVLQGYPYNHLVDIWSLGIIAFEIMVGRTPFRGYSFSATARNILRCTYDFPPHLSCSAKDLIIKQLLRRNPEVRMPLLAVLKHRLVLRFKHTSIIQFQDGLIV